MSLRNIIKKSGKESGKPWPMYAWPGGYEMFYIMDDGGCLCGGCMNDKTNPIHFQGDNDGWKVIDVDSTANTDDDVTCAHCGKIIQEAYVDEEMQANDGRDINDGMTVRQQQGD